MKIQCETKVLGDKNSNIEKIISNAKVIDPSQLYYKEQFKTFDAEVRKTKTCKNLQIFDAEAKL